MSRTIKVLHIIDNFRTGGAQRVLSNLAEGLRKNGFEITILNLRRDTPLADDLRSRGVAVESLAFSKSNFLAAGLLKTIIARYKPAIVHTHLDFANAFGARAALNCRVPIIIKHDHTGTTCQNRWYFTKRLLAERFVGSSPRIIAISEDVRQFNLDLGVSGERIHVVLNGVDLQRFSRRKKAPSGNINNGPTVGFVGRLIRRKGVACLVAAAPEVLRRVPSARFVIVGDGPERRRVERQAIKAGLGRAFTFLGFQDQPEKFYEQVDLAVVPSIFEPFGLSAIEAMAMGLPVVASAVGGINEIVEDGISGFLVPPGDAGRLADRIVKLLLDPSLSSRIGAAARERVESSYTVDAGINKVSELYQDLLGENYG